METCRLYTQLEGMRFSNKFNYEFDIDEMNSRRLKPAVASAIGADAYLVKTDLTHDSLWDLIGRYVGAP